MYSTGNSTQCHVATWMGGEFVGEWGHVNVWLSPFAVHLKALQHYLLIGYIPVQNKQLKKLNKIRKVNFSDKYKSLGAGELFI